MTERQLSLTRADATKIVEAVAKDPTCKRLIPDSYFLGSAGYAGSIRNVLNAPGMLVIPDYNPDQKASDEACTGIANATAIAINDKAKKDSLFPAKSANSIDRQAGLLKVHHTATEIVLRSGESYVFDWHATLALKNPMIYFRVSSWKNDMDGVLFKDWTGMVYSRFCAPAN